MRMKSNQECKVNTLQDTGPLFILHRSFIYLYTGPLFIFTVSGEEEQNESGSVQLQFYYTKTSQ
jgi:hypothetical protein